MSVYFVAVGGMVKVGYSQNPLRRAARLFSGTTLYSAPAAAYDVRGTQVLLGYIPGEKDDERQVHLALSDFSAGLEWFVDEPPVREYLAHLKSHPGSYIKVHRQGGPVEVSELERAGGNVRAQASVLRKRYGDAVADQMVSAIDAERAGDPYVMGEDLANLWIRTSVEQLMNRDIAEGYLIHDLTTDTVKPTEKWRERERAEGAR